MTFHEFRQSEVHRINDYLLFRDKWQFVREITKKKKKDTKRY